MIIVLRREVNKSQKKSSIYNKDSNAFTVATLLRQF